MGRTPTPAELERIEAALSAGDKILAIKLCRDFTGLGLAEAKSYVEALSDHPAGNGGQSPILDSTPVAAAIFSGHTIEAIKLYREGNPGVGLKEAKEAVEKAAAELYQRNPGKFVRPPKSAGCLPILAIGFLLPAVACYWLAR